MLPSRAFTPGRAEAKPEGEGAEGAKTECAGFGPPPEVFRIPRSLDREWWPRGGGVRPQSCRLTPAAPHCCWVFGHLRPGCLCRKGISLPKDWLVPKDAFPKDHQSSKFYEPVLLKMRMMPTDLGRQNLFAWGAGECVPLQSGKRDEGFYPIISREITKLLAQ